MNYLLIFLQFLQIFFLVSIFIILAYIAYVMISFRNMVPYVPTPARVIKRMINLANIQSGEKIADLGSGSGRILIRIAKRHKRNYVIGIEKSFIMRIISKLRFLLHPILRKRVQIINQDFLNIDLDYIDVIFCFLTPEALRLLEPKFKMLKKGSRIVSYMFHLEDHQGFEETIDHITAKDSIYVYKKV